MNRPGDGYAGTGASEQWTPSGVRLRRISAGPEPWNWLFLPGGPGLGSESVAGLAEVAAAAGTVWLVDLPGDGSNRGVPAVAQEPYALWPGVLAEAAQAVDHAVMVGHSSGGMYMLSVPELEDLLSAMVLVASAPDTSWRDSFTRWSEQNPLPQVDAAAEEYARHPDDASVRALTLAAAPWSFTEAALPAGRRLLDRLPYCHDSVAWADAHFDQSYEARWVPRTLPTLILAGAEDRIIDQGVWDADSDAARAFDRPNVLRRSVPDAGHFPWVDNPAPVRAAFAELVGRLG